MMITANYQVQNILRAYGQQLAEKSKIAKIKPNKPLALKDQVIISQESKKRLVTEKITQEIISQFMGGSATSETSQAVLKRLGQEYGRPLKIEGKDGKELVFKLAKEDSEEGEGEVLSFEESEKLKEKLFAITRSIVYNNLT